MCISNFDFLICDTFFLVINFTALNKHAHNLYINESRVSECNRRELYMLQH